MYCMQLEHLMLARDPVSGPLAHFPSLSLIVVVSVYTVCSFKFLYNDSDQYWQFLDLLNTIEYAVRSSSKLQGSIPHLQYPS